MEKIVIAPESNQNFLFDLKKMTLDGNVVKLNFTIHQSATVDINLVGVGEFNLEFNLNLDLVGINAQVNLKGAFLITKASYIKFNVRQNHFVPNAQSHVTIKTVLLDESQFIYDGTILITEHASGTIANQMNQNIVLSPNATVQSVPKIEVLNSDVQCGHGSAVGGLDQAQIVYLMSRGLDCEQATRLLIQSFLGINASILSDVF